ncbi:MAG TPA: DUF885 family protein [Allosphingosinicella sp.]|jgi:uncharacterized protein (DUF885 family)
MHPFIRSALPVAAIVLTAAMQPAPSAAEQRFKALYEREWRWRQSEAGGGEEESRVRSRLPDVTPRAQEARLRYWQQVLGELSRIERAQLTPDRQLDYDVFRYQIETLAASQRFRDWEKPLNSDSSFWSDLAYTARRPLRTEEEYRSYISMLRGMPRYFREQVANMRAGLARGFTPPRITLEGRDAGLAAVAQATSPEATVWYEPFRNMAGAVPAARHAELRARAVEAIRTAVIPAHAETLRFMRTEYVPGARTALAATTLPDGEAYYRSKIREFTTLDLTAEQVHAIGLEQVAMIRAQMHEVMREVGFQGDLSAFLTFLRTDPRFYATTPEQLLREGAWIAKQFDGISARWFGRQPRARFAIRAVPDDIAPFYTTGRGGPGGYLINTYDLPSRPLYSLRALTLHEAAPGHAMQMSLAAENRRHPEFRREYYISAYGEGWALYTEKLGVEMGMYETPYDRFGMLSYQMWRAARLVVDTGIHAKGWTRERARAFMTDNTALSAHEIGTEVDRYIAWPGQALSYYLGQMAIEEARGRAERALGDRFDIRRFHDAVLELGSVPLPVLHARIDRFIAEGGPSPWPEETD